MLIEKNTQTVNGIKDKKTIKLQIDSSTAIVNDNVGIKPWILAQTDKIEVIKP